MKGHGGRPGHCGTQAGVARVEEELKEQTRMSGGDMGAGACGTEGFPVESLRPSQPRKGARGRGWAVGGDGNSKGTFPVFGTAHETTHFPTQLRES